MAPWELFGLELKYKKKPKICTSAEIKGVFNNIYRYYGNTLSQENVVMTEQLFKAGVHVKAVLTSLNTAFLPNIGHVSRNVKSLCLFH